MELCAIMSNLGANKLYYCASDILQSVLKLWVVELLPRIWTVSQNSWVQTAMHSWLSGIAFKL